MRIKIGTLLNELRLIKSWFWLSLPPGIGGVVAAIRAVYLVATVWETENIYVYKREPGVIRAWVSREIKAMESELEVVRQDINRDAEILGKDPERALHSPEGSQRLESYWQFMLNRRRTASTAWAIWAAVQFALGSMLLGIISLAVRC